MYMISIRSACTYIQILANKYKVWYVYVLRAMTSFVSTKYRRVYIYIRLYAIMLECVFFYAEAWCGNAMTVAQRNCVV